MTLFDTNSSKLDLRAFLTFRLAQLQSHLNSQAQHILRTHSDLGQSEWRALLLVAERGVSTLAYIVRDGQMDKAQVSRAIKSLVEKGYLNTKPDPSDQRQHLLSLTDAGTQLHDHVRPHMLARQRHLIKDLSEDDVATLFRILDQLEEAAERRDF